MSYATMGAVATPPRETWKLRASRARAAAAANVVLLPPVWDALCALDAPAELAATHALARSVAAWGRTGAPADLDAADIATFEATMGAYIHTRGATTVWHAMEVAYQARRAAGLWCAILADDRSWKKTDQYRAQRAALADAERVARQLGPALGIPAGTWTRALAEELAAARRDTQVVK